MYDIDIIIYHNTNEYVTDIVYLRWKPPKLPGRLLFPDRRQGEAAVSKSRAGNYGLEGPSNFEDFIGTQNGSFMVTLRCVHGV